MYHDRNICILFGDRPLQRLLLQKRQRNINHKKFHILGELTIKMLVFINHELSLLITYPPLSFYVVAFVNAITWKAFIFFLLLAWKVIDDTIAMAVLWDTTKIKWRHSTGWTNMACYENFLNVDIAVCDDTSQRKTYYQNVRILSYMEVIKMHWHVYSPLWSDPLISEITISSIRHPFGSLLLTWINFNSNMGKWSHPL